MKILCVSDQIDPLIYNQNAHKNFPDIDLILCAGDLPMDYVDFIVSVFNKPTYFIFGNHDLKEFKYYHGTMSAPPRPTTSAQSTTSIEIHFESIKEDHHHGANYAGFKNICLNNISYIVCADIFKTEFSESSLRSNIKFIKMPLHWFVYLFWS